MRNLFIVLLLAAVAFCAYKAYTSGPRRKKTHAANGRRAIASYEEALAVYRKDEYPVDYAMTQSNLGNALMYLPSATAQERAQNVRRAVACY